LEIDFILLQRDFRNVLSAVNFNRPLKKKQEMAGPKNLLAGVAVLFASSLILYMDRVVRDEKPKTTAGSGARRLYGV